MVRIKCCLFYRILITETGHAAAGYGTYIWNFLIYNFKEFNIPNIQPLLQNAFIVFDSSENSDVIFGRYCSNEKMKN